MVDDFIGSTFPTPKGGVLTVVGKLPKVSGNVIYTLSCNICEKDKELFPDHFTAPKGPLVSGIIPCGCSTRVSWSKEQYYIIVSRVSKENNYTFSGFSGEWVGRKTRLNLRCNVDGHVWDNTTVDSCIMGNRGCKVCNALSSKRKKDDTAMVESFRSSGKYHKDDVFIRDSKTKDRRGKYPYWDYKCVKCSKDQFTLNGLCCGIFKIKSTSLRRGIKPCRCSRTYRWSTLEREYQINKICDEETLKFIGWEDGEYTDSHCKIIWSCKEGHICRTHTSGFISSGTRCGKCASLGRKQNFELIEGKEQEPDTCYLLLFECVITGEIFIKIGRTFDRCYKDRLTCFRKHYKVTELAANKEVHENAVKMERDYHNYLSEYHYTPKIPFGGSVLECFTIEALDLLDY